MAQKCKKRRDVVETQLNLPRGIQNNHFFGQIPKSLTTPPPSPTIRALCADVDGNGLVLGDAESHS